MGGRTLIRIYADDGITLVERQCSCCRKVLPVSEFGVDNSRKGTDGFSYRCKSCSRQQGQDAYKRKGRPEIERMRRNAERNNRENPKQTLMRWARNRAKRRGMEFNITVDDFEIPEFCPVLGIKLDWSPGQGRDRNRYGAVTLDRIDSSKGYVPGNVEVISRRANWLKCDATAEEIDALHRYYVREGRLTSGADCAKIPG